MGSFPVFFHHVKIMHTTRGPMREGKKEDVTFFYGNEANLFWNSNHWQWREGLGFLNYTTKFGRDTIINKILGSTKAAEKWQDLLPNNYNSIGNRCGTRTRQARRPHSFGQFGIKQLRLMN